jgi:hypothetical protein
MTTPRSSDPADETSPIRIAGDRWTTQWVDLRYSTLPPWRRLAAVLTDGRVCLATKNVFKSHDQVTLAGNKLGRPYALLEHAGHDYAELDVFRVALADDAAGLEQLRAIEAVVRETIAAAADADIHAPAVAATA